MIRVQKRGTYPSHDLPMIILFDDFNPFHTVENYIFFDNYTAYTDSGKLGIGDLYPEMKADKYRTGTTTMSLYTVTSSSGVIELRDVCTIKQT